MRAVAAEKEVVGGQTGALNGRSGVSRGRVREECEGIGGREAEGAAAGGTKKSTIGRNVGGPGQATGFGGLARVHLRAALLRIPGGGGKRGAAGDVFGVPF